MFIGRKPDGTIYGAWTSKQPNDADHPGIEEVADDHPDLIAFVAEQDAKMKAPMTTAQKLAALGITPAELKAELAK